MSLMQRVVQQLLHQLIDAELLELVPGSTIADLEEELLAAIGQAPGFSQATPFLASQILSSQRVHELYASDDQLREIMKHLEV